MSTQDVPGYEEWRRYCFTRGYADFHSDDDEASERAERYLCLPSMTLLQYLQRCFNDAASIAADFDSQQIGDSVWFLFGPGSGYFSELRSSGTPPSALAACYRSVSTLYRACFDQVCCLGAEDPDGAFIRLNSAPDRPDDRVDGAVYMIWDMGEIDGPLGFPDEYPELFEASVDVLREALMHCRTSSCKISALHGVGHLHDERPKVAERLVDGFLKRGKHPQWVVDYAKAARRGGVQ